MKLQFAIAAFLLILAAVELLEWMKDRTMPLPMTLLGGLALAVGSNYRKLPIEAWLVQFLKSRVTDSQGEGE